MAIGGVKNYLRIQDAIKYLRAHPLKVLGYASGSNALIEWMKSGLDDQRVLQNLAGLLRKQSRRNAHGGGGDLKWT